MPSLTPILIYRGQPNAIIDEATQLSTVTARYTVPTGKRLLLKHVRLSNLNNTEGTEINMKTGTAINTSDGDFVFRNIAIEPNDVLIFEFNEVLNAGDKIFIWNNVLTNVSVQISGIEVTL